MPLLGAHVSSAGGLHTAIGRGEALGASVIQCFGASPRQWSAPMPTKTALAAFKEARDKSGIKQVYLHAAYLVNLGTAEAPLRERSVKNLQAHFQIANAIEADGLIFHLGGIGEQLREAAVEYAVHNIEQVLHAAEGATALIIENTASPIKLGAAPEEIGAMLRQIGSPRLKVCIDTAHAFEAGIIEEYTPKGIRNFMKLWEESVGLDRVSVLHVNDSKTPANSHHDLHENLGEGHIGLEGFRTLAQEQKLHDKAWILEVPGFEGFGPDERNMALLKSCFA